MARVKLTQQLQQNILSKIKAKYYTQRSTLLSDFITKNRETIYRLVVSEELEEKLRGLPSGFQVTNAHMSFEHAGHQYDIPFQRDRFLPTQYHSSYSHTKLMFPAPLADEAKEMQDKRSQLNKESENVCEELKKIMKQAETLKQLVEVWPSALDLCEPHVIEQYNKKPKAREKPEKIEISDSSKLALVKVRMT